MLISSIEKNSIAEKKGIRKGSALLKINNHEITDVLDYRFHINCEKLILTIKTPDDKYEIIKIVKDEFEDIGLVFETYLMDKQRSCKNKCIFCFIDQLPKGLRDSLYFKDDDSRLSFLFGNYITLTNLDDREAQRIIDLHISPVNISVHTMNPELRVKMMANPHAGESLKYLYKFAESETKINTQIVCCPGINDGKELEFSLRELYKLYPSVQSIACVPLGLTKHREGLYPLHGYDKESAGEVIDIIEKINREFSDKTENPIAYAADEFYIYAERPMPDSEFYNGFPQLENGVGMWSLLKEEFLEALKECTLEKSDRDISVVTGCAAFPLIKELCAMACEKIKGLNVNVYEAENRLFGSSITVSGLLCGADIEYALKGKDLGKELIIPPNCLRSEGDIFLDDMSVEELSNRLKVKITQNGPSGEELLSALTGGIY